MSDDDATCMMSFPPDFFQESAGAADEASDVMRRSPRGPLVGVASVGETYFGDTQVGSLSKVEVRPSGSGRNETSSARGSKSASSAASSRCATSTGAREVFLVKPAMNQRRIFVFMCALGVALAGVTYSWLGHKALPSAKVDVATAEPGLSKNKSPQVDAALVEPAELQLSAPAPSGFRLSEEERQRARAAARSMRTGDCGGALEYYQRLVNQDGARGARWRLFLDEARRRCLNTGDEK